jgi:hypothetical protein
MLTSAADLIQELGRSPIEALQECAEKFFSLLSSYALLSPEKQVGLWCELWLLARLIETEGSHVVHSWIGPIREPHDFRFGNIEIEVKGTRGVKRTHLISSEEQLNPSDGCELYLLSLQIEPSGGDDCESLAALVTRVRAGLSDDAVAKKVFNNMLREAKFLDAHAGFYTDRFRLRKGPMLVPVVGEFPRVTKGVLSEVLEEDACKRVSEIKYRLDVSDLGFVENDEEFQKVLRT